MSIYFNFLSRRTCTWSSSICSASPCLELLFWFCHPIWMICNSFLTSFSASTFTLLQLILHRRQEWSFKIKIWLHHPFLSLYFSLASIVPAERPKGWTYHRILVWYNPCLLSPFPPTCSRVLSHWSSFSFLGVLISTQLRSFELSISSAYRILSTTQFFSLLTHPSGFNVTVISSERPS